MTDIGKPMEISSYQIHNVLRVYKERLIRHRISEPHHNMAPEEGVSAGGKRQAVIEMVADNIISKISSSGGNHTIVRKRICPRKTVAGGHIIPDKAEEYKFVYNMIDENDQKTTCVLFQSDLQDAAFLVK